jgi:hypothetical protein
MSAGRGIAFSLSLPEQTASSGNRERSRPARFSFPVIIRPARFPLPHRRFARRLLLERPRGPDLLARVAHDLAGFSGVGGGLLTWL